MSVFHARILASDALFFDGDCEFMVVPCTDGAMGILSHHSNMIAAVVPSGGLQDVYTYLFRGKVFANAQTGNIVLMAVHAFAGEWGRVLHYLVPCAVFALGVFAAELMHRQAAESAAAPLAAAGGAV